jgi:hypothetical protein
MLKKRNKYTIDQINKLWIEKLQDEPLIAFKTVRCFSAFKIVISSSLWPCKKLLLGMSVWQIQNRSAVLPEHCHYYIG